eukprot:SAG11_NODE_193_length_12862_cov_7.128888_7_plen_189_part_00
MQEAAAEPVFERTASTGLVSVDGSVGALDLGSVPRRPPNRPPTQATLPRTVGLSLGFESIAVAGSSNLIARVTCLLLLALSRWVALRAAEAALGQWWSPTPMAVWVAETVRWALAADKWLLRSLAPPHWERVVPENGSDVYYWNRAGPTRELCSPSNRRHHFHESCTSLNLRLLPRYSGRNTLDPSRR